MLPINQLFEQALPVMVVDRVQICKDWVCPHCENVIGEKETFYDQENDVWIHRACGGEIELPPSEYSEEQLSNLGRSALEMMKRNGE